MTAYVSFVPRKLSAKGGTDGTTNVQNEGSGIFHTYSSYSRGIDILNCAYQYLDLVPKGRDEKELKFPMEWVRRHDQY